MHRDRQNRSPRTARRVAGLLAALAAAALLAVWAAGGEPDPESDVRTLVGVVCDGQWTRTGAKRLVESARRYAAADPAAAAAMGLTAPEGGGISVGCPAGRP